MISFVLRRWQNIICIEQSLERWTLDIPCNSVQYSDDDRQKKGVIYQHGPASTIESFKDVIGTFATNDDMEVLLQVEERAKFVEDLKRREEEEEAGQDEKQNLWKRSQDGKWKRMRNMTKGSQKLGKQKRVELGVVQTCDQQLEKSSNELKEKIMEFTRKLEVAVEQKGILEEERKI